MGDPVLIVGGGQAGASCADALRRAGYAGLVTLICAEPHPPYQRPPLSKGYLAGKVARERLYIRPESFWQKKDIDLIQGDPVVSVDVANKSVQLASGRVQKWSKLVLATGSNVRRLPVAGDERVHYIRTIDDVERLKAALPGAARVAIIGAGFIGLETAAVLRAMDLQVTVIDAEDRVMARVMPPVLSDWFRSLHERQGVLFRLGAGVEAINQSGVHLSNGDLIDADLVVAGIGIFPETGLGEEAGLDCDDGILVNGGCRTSHEDIFAIGECCRHPNRFTGGLARLESVQNAGDQAKVAAANIMGRTDVRYDAVPWFWSDQYDVKLQMAGWSVGHDSYVLRGDPATGRFSVFYFREGKLVGADSVGAAADHMATRKLLQAGTPVTPLQASDIGLPLKNIV